MLARYPGTAPIPFRGRAWWPLSVRPAPDQAYRCEIGTDSSGARPEVVTMIARIRAHCATIARASAVVAAILAFPFVLAMHVAVGEARAAAGALGAWAAAEE